MLVDFFRAEPIRRSHQGTVGGGAILTVLSLIFATTSCDPTDPPSAQCMVRYQAETVFHLDPDIGEKYDVHLSIDGANLIVHCPGTDEAGIVQRVDNTDHWVEGGYAGYCGQREYTLTGGAYSEVSYLVTDYEREDVNSVRPNYRDLQQDCGVQKVADIYVDTSPISRECLEDPSCPPNRPTWFVPVIDLGPLTLHPSRCATEDWAEADLLQAEAQGTAELNENLAESFGLSGYSGPICWYPPETPYHSSAFENIVDAVLRRIAEFEGLLVHLSIGGFNGFRPEVVHILVGAGECSGVVLTGNVILTAGHCLDAITSTGTCYLQEVRLKTSSSGVPPNPIIWPKPGYSPDFVPCSRHPSHVSNDGNASNDVGVLVLPDVMAGGWYRGRLYNTFSVPPNDRDYFIWGYIDNPDQNAQTFMSEGRLEYARYRNAAVNAWAGVHNVVPVSTAHRPGSGDSGGPIGFMSYSPSTSPNYDQRYLVTSLTAVTSSNYWDLGTVWGERMPENISYLINTAGPALGCNFQAGCPTGTSYGYPMRRCETCTTCGTGIPYCN